MTTTPKQRRQRTGPNSQGETLTVWDALSTAAKPQLADIPQAAADQAAFEGHIADIKVANAEQESLIAKLRDSYKTRREMAKQARILRNRIVSHLQSKFGPDSERLREFGLRPKGRSVRRKAAANTPAALDSGGSLVNRP
jgi:hypothetical protein